MDQIDELIRQANQALGRIKILMRDRKLALHGTLPCKPGEGRGTKRAVISLGIFANPARIKIDFSQARDSYKSILLDDTERGG